MKTDKVDLLHLHNVRNADQSMAGVNALKAKGLCRYTGVTTTFERDYPAYAGHHHARKDYLRRKRD